VIVNIEILRGRITELESELRTIHTGAGDRALNDDETTRWETTESELAQCRADLAAAEEAEVRAARIAEQRAKYQSLQIGTVVPDTAEVTDVRALSVGEARDRALKRLDKTQDIAGLSAEQMAKVSRLIRTHSRDTDGDKIARALLATETDAYRSAFMKGITQASPVFTPDEARAVLEARAASLTDNVGGYGVPVSLDSSIVLAGQQFLNPFRRIARQVTITSDVWQGVSSAGVSWSFDNEAAAVSDDAPTLSNPSITPAQARGFIPYSIQIGEDYPSFAAEFGRLLMEGYEYLQATAFCTGASGVVGIVTALDANTNVEVSVTTDGLFTATDIDKVWTELPDRAKANATWLMSSDVASYIGLWGDAYGGRTVDLAGVPTTLRGAQLAIASGMPSFTGTTGAANILVVGDFRNYVIVDRAGMSVEFIPHLFDVTDNRPTGQRGLFAHARVGADSIDDLSFRILQNT
jgi:HK97 family phage major capsid protein